MKYIRLTKEQLDTLHEEFARFLAAQSITADEWAKIKREKPYVALAELDTFSDLIWEGVLNSANYLENISKDQVFCIAIKEDHLALIHLKATKPGIDLNTPEGRTWLVANLKDDSVSITSGKKSYKRDRNSEVFELMKQGAEIVDSTFYDALEKLIN